MFSSINQCSMEMIYCVYWVARLTNCVNVERRHNQNFMIFRHGIFTIQTLFHSQQKGGSTHNMG